MKIIIKCVKCDKEISATPSQVKAGKKYCSKVCMDSGKSVIQKCLNCGKDFKVWLSRMKKGCKYCSKHCADTSEILREKMREIRREKPGFKKGQTPWNKGIEWKEMTGENHPNWKGGKTATKDEYIKILQKGHPLADCYGYVLRSHIVAEKCLGRFLEKGEVIHHIDHNRINDDPKNLYLFTTQTEHRRYHSENYPIQSNLV